MDVFEQVPAASLLATGNIPAVGELADTTFCVVAPADIAARVTTSTAGQMIGRHARLHVVPSDELVVDGAFDVVPSLAYLRGITDSGDALTRTSFVFLQPNLILGDGALRSVMQRLTGGARALTATYLHVEREAIRARLGGRAGAQVAPRELVRHALESLDARDLANVVNANFSLVGPVGRLLWRDGGSTLLVHDFMPSLVALRPDRAPGHDPGFRDVAFAAIMCANAVPQHLTDSDEFVGVEVTANASEAAVSVGVRSPATDVDRLAGRISAAQGKAAAENQSRFHEGELPAEASATSVVATAYVRRVADALAAVRPPAEDRRWRLAHYLWKVRRFELGRGPLPHERFEELFAHSLQLAQSQAADPKVPLFNAVRWLRGVLFGRVPLVTLLHPDWLDYRAVGPVLRAATSVGKDRVLYVGDGAAVFANALGAPDFGSSQILDGTYDRKPAPAGSLDTLIMELSASGLQRCANLLTKLAPAVRRGGRIVVFHHNSDALATGQLAHALTSAEQRANALEFERASVSIVRCSPYRSWLREGRLIWIAYVRARTVVGLLKGASIFALVNMLLLLMNIANLWSRRGNASDHTFSSLTITLDVSPSREFP